MATGLLAYSHATARSVTSPVVTFFRARKSSMASKHRTLPVSAVPIEHEVRMRSGEEGRPPEEVGLLHISCPVLSCVLLRIGVIACPVLNCVLMRFGVIARVF
jgi:hypothetical protein